MGIQVCASAMCMCSFGVAPGTLSVLMMHLTNTGGPPAANIMNNTPMAEVTPFAMCTSPANPAVAAALMVPQACTPMPAGPWFPGAPTVLLGNMPALDSNCKLMCAFGGLIQIIVPGEFQTMVP